MAQYKTEGTPLLTHSSNYSLALSDRYVDVAEIVEGR